MSCDLSNVAIHFLESGIKVRPFSIDIRRSRQNDNKFDHVQATITREAGEHIIDKHTFKEPIEIKIDEENVIYRGWYKTDSTSLGRNEAVLEIKDPRKILRSGTVDQEWHEITLKNVVEYIFERRQDPHNVLRVPSILSSQAHELKAQHNVFLNGSDMVEDFLLETIPFANGDGNFDFREESPYSALMEVMSIWETSFWVNKNGILVVGPPDLLGDTYGAGRGYGNWHISEWNLPDNTTPLKAVVVKGQMDQKQLQEGDKDWGIITDRQKYETRAAAGFLDDNELEETIILNGKKETTDPKALKNMARSAFKKQHTKNNRGSMVIDVTASSGIPTSEFVDLRVGDRVLVNNANVRCDVLNEGVYAIHSVQHDITGSDGWTITLEVTKTITNGSELKERFWYFDPTDPDMASDSLPTQPIQF
jgi:hypothetical protein